MYAKHYLIFKAYIKIKVTSKHFRKLPTRRGHPAEQRRQRPEFRRDGPDKGEGWREQKWSKQDFSRNWQQHCATSNSKEKYFKLK